MNRIRNARVVAVASATVLALSGCGGSSASSSPTPSRPAPSGIGTPTDFTLPDTVRNLPLTTSTGAHTTLAQLQGRVVMLSDTMTLCEEACPVDTAGVVATARQQDAAGHGNDVVYVSLTVDPARDTTAQIAAYQKLFQPVPSNWMMTTGPVNGVNALWKQLGVLVERTRADDDATNWRTGEKLTYDIEHSDQVFFLGRDGHVRFTFSGTPNVSASTMPRTLDEYLSKEGHKNLEHPDDTAWTPQQAAQVIDWLV